MAEKKYSILRDNQNNKLVTAYGEYGVEYGIQLGEHDKFHTNSDGKPYFNEQELALSRGEIFITEYDLSSQIDGVKTSFSIDSDINSDMFVTLEYAGQTLVRNLNYTVNFSTHAVEVLFSEPLDTDDGRRLILRVFSAENYYQGGNGGSVTLYPSTGQNIDGAMTQKAVTDALALKADKSALYEMRSIPADDEIEAVALSKANPNAWVYVYV